MRRRALGLLFSLALPVIACHSRTSGEAPPGPSGSAVAVAAPAPAPPRVPVRLERVGRARESSALVLTRLAHEGGETLRAFLADEDEQAIVELDPGTSTIVRTTALGSRPRDLLVLGDGRLAVTLPDEAVVAVFVRDRSGGLVEDARLATTADPMSMAVDEQDTVLHVTAGASHTLLTFDAKLAERRRVTLGREPRAVLVHGERTYVTHAIEDFVSVVAPDGAVTTTDVSNRATCHGGSRCSSARTARHAQAIARFGDHGIVVPAAQVLPVPSPAFSKSAFCPNLEASRAQAAAAKALGDGGYGFGNEENGPPVTSDVAVLDAASGKRWATALPPNLGIECKLPRAATSDDRSVLVACLGSSRIVRYTAKATPDEEWRGKFSFDPKGKAPRGSFPNGVVPNVSATRIDVPAGPTAIALGEGADVFVWSSFARQLSLVRGDRAEPLPALPRSARLSREWLAGRALFFTNGDPRISKDGRACANCHIDGADDGLAWKTPSGLRRTRLLRGELDSGPYGWMGEHSTLKEHVETTLSNLKGRGLSEDDLADLLAFVTQLKRPTRAHAAFDVARGKEVFTTAECAKCHTDGGTDRKVHDVGTGGAFMTPTLASANVRRSFLHDGRYATLDELLAQTPNMGRGAELGEDDRRALAAYLETL